MSATFYIKQGDIGPRLEHQLLQAGATPQADAVPVDLTGATVKLNVRLAGMGTLLFSRAATIDTAATGMVGYDWQTADTLTAGSYLGEWQVTFPGAIIVTFPNDGYFRILIARQVA